MVDSRFNFRVWKGKENRMVYNVTYLNPLLLDPNIDPENKHNILMQCTGMKDKNGKLIYEGDIIQIPDDYDTYGMFAGEKREIYFNEGGFRLKPKWDKNSRGNWLEDTEDFEIIGNIYENPTLI